ncbi:probable DEAD/DEAH box helicase (plasmid) [Halobacterium hubeiense]|uniref:Probable DEAD/DEAH box helicase n=1 Tax=Halobacterium hubeiense TaxID=1407499 RepID=A0A0U5HY30_9EURY|nr:DEAD/DEAH box helicase [Halobacterium hubeiense]CQH63563.1 probable DEAD/DEAH box helicase [Halobacterium hubeiense]
MDTYSVAAELESFNRCLDQMAENLIRDDLGVRETGGLSNWGNQTISPHGDLTQENVEKSAWVASFLASSDDSEHKRKALAFGILSYLHYNDTEYEEMYERYLYIILSRVGNLPAFRNVKRSESRVNFKADLIHSLDSVLGTELGTNSSRYSLENGDVLSEFQKEIYEHLLAGRNVAISGPTSAGKSFILRRYIEEMARQPGNFEVIYVVPTRALISEVSQKLTDLNDSLDSPENEFDVLTGAHFPEDEDRSDNSFLVVTPERCLKLIDPDVRKEIDPNLVFFDEVQNIEDDERGVLFENIVRSLEDYYSSAQVVAAGPYLENPQETLEDLTSNEVAEVKTGFTPVLQMRCVLRFISQNRSKNRKLEVRIHSPSGNIEEIEVPEPESMTYSEVKGNKKKSLRKIVRRFGSDSKNLVYSSRKDYAEDRAKYIAQDKEKQTSSEELDDLINFLEETIHEDYSLIDCLQRGVAFHHGMVPKIAREKIEEIYSNQAVIDTIVTTPTLMQGVNLPAEKIFLVSSNRGQNELSDFEFGNLIGRVGRIDTKLYGAIYCIEGEDEEWADNKLENTGDKAVEPATNQAVDDSDELINALQQEDLGSVEEPSVKYTSVLLRGRYLKDQEISSYLSNKGMEEGEIERVNSALERTLSDIEIPNSLLRKNPTVDPIKQDILFNVVQSNPEQWIIGTNSRDFSYSSFLRITRQLNKIFKFTNDDVAGVDPEHVETDYGALEPIVVTANHWLRGDTYHAMIESRRDAENVNDGSLDKSIRNVLELVNTDIRFVLVKYYGILTTILEYLDYETPEWMLNFDQMLEMGSMEFNRIHLMSRGVDRSIAVALYLPQSVDDPVAYLNENSGRIVPFHRSHLENQGIL